MPTFLIILIIIGVRFMIVEYIKINDTTLTVERLQEKMEQEEGNLKVVFADRDKNVVFSYIYRNNRAQVESPHCRGFAVIQAPSQKELLEKVVEHSRKYYPNSKFYIRPEFAKEEKDILEKYGEALSWSAYALTVKRLQRVFPDIISFRDGKNKKEAYAFIHRAKATLSLPHGEMRIKASSRKELYKKIVAYSRKYYPHAGFYFELPPNCLPAAWDAEDIEVVRDVYGYDIEYKKK